MINKEQVQQIIEKEDEGPTLDYKEDLILETKGDKAQFVKDVLSLANSGQTAHIIIGIEDGTRKLKEITTSHKAEQMNDILKNKCDPPLTVEYAEIIILGHKIGVIEFTGQNPPYIVSVDDQFGGELSSNPKKTFNICRGTVFVRSFNKNEGASRADLDKMYKVKYITLQPDLQLSHKVKLNQSDDSIEADIEFYLINLGDVLATDIFIYMRFLNIKKIVRCYGVWKDESAINEGSPIISAALPVPVVRPVQCVCRGVVIQVGKDVVQVETKLVIGATNMRIKEGSYVIPLKESHLDPKAI